MAPSNNIEDAGRRLARDMRAIRQSRAITSDAIIRATKAAPNVVTEFETTALVDNPMYNRVYLRLFVRGYAQVIGIRSDDALRAIDEVLEGSYTDRLARVYLDRPGDLEKAREEKSTERPEAEKKPEPEPEKPVPREVDAPRSKEKEPAAKSKSGGGPKPPPKSGDSAAKQTAKSKAGQRAKAAKHKGPATKVASKPGTSSRRPPVKPPRKLLLPDSTSLLRTVGAVLGGLAVVLVAWVLWPQRADQAPEPSVVPEDTLTTPVPQLPPRVVLGDTTSFYVVAARAVLEPVRVTVDGGVRRPYWIEMSDSMEFSVTDNLVIEGRIPALDVSVRDVLVPTTSGDPTGRLVITKAQVQALLDSLRAAGAPPQG